MTSSPLTRHSKNLVWLFQYQLFRYLEHLLKSSIFPCFLMKCELSEYLFPMETDASNVEDINIPHIQECCCCLVLLLLKIRPTSFAFDHSICARMIVSLEKDSLLWRRQSPYHQWQTCHVRVSSYLCCVRHFTRFSNLRTTCRQCSILRSLMT